MVSRQDRRGLGDRVACPCAGRADRAGEARGVPRLVVVREDDRRPAVRPEGPLAAPDRRRERRPPTTAGQELPVEDEVAVAVSAPRRPRSSRRTARRPTSARARVDDGPEPADEGRAGPAGRCRRGGPGGSRPSSRAGVGLDGSPGCLRKTLNVSSRNPSTPRSSQPRTMSNCAASTRGYAPVELGLLGQERVVDRTGRAPARRSRPARRTTRPSRSAAAARPRRVDPGRVAPQVPVGAWARSGRGGTRRTTGARRSCGSSRGRGSTRIPRRWASPTSRSKSPSVPNLGSIARVVADVVADVDARRRVDRRQPDRRRRRDRPGRGGRGGR